MKKVLFILAFISMAALANAQFVISAQLGGSYFNGFSSSESIHQTVSPDTGIDTVIYGFGDTVHFDKPLALSGGIKIGYQTRKMQFGIAAIFSFSHLHAEQTAAEYYAANPNTEVVKPSIAVRYKDYVGWYKQYRTSYTIAPYVRYELIQLGDVTFFAELNGYFTKVNNAKHHDFLDWYYREMHNTIDTSFTIPESSTSLGAKIVPGLCWQLSPHCSVDLYFDIMAFSFDYTTVYKRTIIDEYDYTTLPRVLARRTTIDATTTSTEMGFAVTGSPLLSNRNWVRVGFNYTF